MIYGKDYNDSNWTVASDFNPLLKGGGHRKIYYEFIV